jgi:hypothetical protein
MKTIIFLLTLLLFFNVSHSNIYTGYLNTLTDTIPKKVKVKSAKSENLFCSGFGKTKYKLLINGNKIKIIRLYKEYTSTYTGVIKNGKIYSNDPDEKSLKDVWGKYYKLVGKNFGVLNIENGDYEWFTECKQ